MTAPRVLVVEVDVHKTYLMSANARPHWSKARQQTRVLRDLAATHLRLALDGVRPLPAKGRPLMQRAHIDVDVAWPDRRHRDAANIAPTLKALVDGFVTDGHLLPDDDDTHLTGPHPWPLPEPSGARDITRLTFRIEERP